MPKTIPSYLIFLTEVKSDVALLVYISGMTFAILWLMYCVRRQTFSSLIEMHKLGKKGDRFAKISARVGWMFIAFSLLYVLLNTYVGFSLISFKNS